MLEEEDQLLEMRGLQFPVDAEKRVRNGVGEVCALQILLKIKDVIAMCDDVGVLGLSQPPNEKMDFARILRKISGNLLTYERVGQVSDAQTAFDRVVVRQGDKV